MFLADLYNKNYRTGTYSPAVPIMTLKDVGCEGFWIFSANFTFSKTVLFVVISSENHTNNNYINTFALKQA